MSQEPDWVKFSNWCVDTFGRNILFMSVYEIDQALTLWRAKK